MAVCDSLMIKKTASSTAPQSTITQNLWCYSRGNMNIFKKKFRPIFVPPNLWYVQNLCSASSSTIFFFFFFFFFYTIYKNLREKATHLPAAFYLFLLLCCNIISPSYSYIVAGLDYMIAV
jgi:hypothetical protein